MAPTRRAIQTAERPLHRTNRVPLSCAARSTLSNTPACNRGITPLALLVVVTAPAAAHAQTIITPSIAATEAGNSFVSYMFYGTSSATTANESRMLSLYDARDISTTGAVLQSLQVRRPSTIGNANNATTISVKIDMSLSKRASSAISSTFATNHDSATLVSVFNGSINLPQRARGTWPEPWETKIAFSTPFLWVKPNATSLAVEVTATGTSAMRPCTSKPTGRRPARG